MDTTYTVAEFKTHYSYGSSNVGAFTIADTAANLASGDLFGRYFISNLIQFGCTDITVTDNEPLTVFIAPGELSAQLVPITSTGPVIIKTDTRTLTPHLTATDLAQLVTYGITGFDLTSDAVTLTQAQYYALKATTLRFSAEDVVTVDGRRVYDINLVPPYTKDSGGRAYFENSDAFHAAAQNPSALQKLVEDDVDIICIENGAPLLTLEEVQNILEARLSVYNGVFDARTSGIQDLDWDALNDIEVSRIQTEGEDLTYADAKALADHEFTVDGLCPSCPWP